MKPVVSGSMIEREERDLQPLFDPVSIAILGASEDSRKWGRWLSEAALRGSDRRQVYFVNKRGNDILGYPAYRHATDIPARPELAVIAVPLANFEDAVDDALAAGARALVAVNAGFAETGEAGLERQRDVVRRVRDAGAVLVGPNCLGVVDTTTSLEAAWLQVGPGGLLSGPVGLISQSGTVAMDIVLLAADAGLGISRLVSLGNQADVTTTDLVRSYTQHEQTKVLALYCEEFHDGRDFLKAIDEARQAGKPVILLAAGSSPASVRAARTHTGALTTDSRVVDAVCRATGAIRANTPAEMVDVMQLLVRAPKPKGLRVGVASDGGGHAIVATDTVSRTGLETPEFSPALQDELSALLSEGPATSNPIDLALANTDPTGFQRVVEVMVRSGEVDAVFLSGSFGGWGAYSAELSVQEAESGRAIARIAKAGETPVVLQTMVPDSEPAVAAREAGLPAFRTPEAAASALHRVARSLTAPPTGLPEAGTSRVAGSISPGYFETRGLLSSQGIPFPKASQVSDGEEAAIAAAEIGYPVAIKAIGLLHKSDQGGVALNLRSADEVRGCVEEMRSRLRCKSFSVEEMVAAPDGVELVVGVRRDPRFGPILALGLGGTLTEIFDDVQLGIVPTDRVGVQALFDRLRGKALLEGPRGRPPCDLERAVEVAVILSEVAFSNPEIAEVEINPLVVWAEGAIALDSRLVLEEAERDGELDLEYGKGRG